MSLGTSSPPATNAEAGPSKQSAEITIPSTGLEYWEYRRACFLAGKPFPSCPASEPLPESYVVSEPPQPLECEPSQHPEGSSVARLEGLLEVFGAEESNVSWNGGVSTVHRRLTGGTKLAKPLRLGLVIKILRAGWIRDGTWPMDPSTCRPVAVPDSPIVAARTLAALEPVSSNISPLSAPALSPKSARKSKAKLMFRREAGNDRVEDAQRRELASLQNPEAVPCMDDIYEKGDSAQALKEPLSPLSPTSRSRLLPNPILGWRWRKKSQ